MGIQHNKIMGGKYVMIAVGVFTFCCFALDVTHGVTEIQTAGVHATVPGRHVTGINNTHKKFTFWNFG